MIAHSVIIPSQQLGSLNVTCLQAIQSVWYPCYIHACIHNPVIVDGVQLEAIPSFNMKCHIRVILIGCWLKPVIWNEHITEVFISFQPCQTVAELA